LPGKPSKNEEKGGEPRKKLRCSSMGRAWSEYIRTPYLRELRPRNLPSSPAKAKLAPLKIRGAKGVMNKYP